MAINRVWFWSHCWILAKLSWDHKQSIGASKQQREEGQSNTWNDAERWVVTHYPFTCSFWVMCCLLLLSIFLKIRGLSLWDDVKIESKWQKWPQGYDLYSAYAGVTPCFGEHLRRKFFFLLKTLHLWSRGTLGDAALMWLPHREESHSAHMRRAHQVSIQISDGFSMPGSLGWLLQGYGTSRSQPAGALHPKEYGRHGGRSISHSIKKIKT